MFHEHPPLISVSVDDRIQEVVVAAPDRVVPHSQLGFEETRGDVRAIPVVRHFGKTIAGTVRTDLDYIRLFILGLDMPLAFMDAWKRIDMTFREPCRTKFRSQRLSPTFLSPRFILSNLSQASLSFSRQRRIMIHLLRIHVAASLNVTLSRLLLSTPVPSAKHEYCNPLTTPRSHVKPVNTRSGFGWFLRNTYLLGDTPIRLIIL